MEAAVKQAVAKAAAKYEWAVAVHRRQATSTAVAVGRTGVQPLCRGVQR